MKTVGQVLVEAREAKHLSFAEAERATKIRVEIIKALERDDFASLPGATYIKGFIKNYGDYLGLESGALLAIFRRQYDAGKAPTFTILPDLSPKELPKFTITPGRAFGLGVSVLVLSFMGYLIAQYQSFAAAPALVISSPEDNLTINNGTVEVVGRTDRDATLTINGQYVQLTDSGAFSVSVSLPEGVSDLTFSAVNKLGRVTTVKKTVSVQVADKAALEGEGATGGQTIETTAPLEVILRIGPEAAFVEVASDATSFSGILGAGVVKTFKAAERIIVKTDNAGSTEVILNGVNQGKMGQGNNSATKTFSR